MKKIVILGLTTLIVLSIGIYTYLTSKNEESIDKKEKQIKSTNMLTMMLETEAGTGVYEETIASEWPIDGYEFNETLSKCENGSELSWDDSTKKVIFASTKADKCYIYFVIKKDPTFADYIIDEVYSVDGTNGLYYHDGQGTYTNANQEAGDNSYRYSGANPDNYVCFGSDAATCPNDNLYRIIGLFDDDKDGVYNIKLIKYDYANSNLLGINGDYNNDYYSSTSLNYYKGYLTTINRYSWNNNTKTNNWSESNLNIINLNTNYWNSLNKNCQDMIATTSWKINSSSEDNINNVSIKNLFNNEIINPMSQTRYDDEIGLMYVSDYGYAVIPEYWTEHLLNFNNSLIQNNNWMFMGIDEWTITMAYYSNSLYPYVFFIYADGRIVYSGGVTYYTAIRPVFYLKESVLIMAGNGSLNNPYRLSL